MPLLDADWLPTASMKRVIVHWTAGGYTANDIDRKAYHILVRGDGRLVRGTHSIADNASTADGVYAAHTLNCNTGSIGVSACCMMGCVRSPFAAGRAPMRESQWRLMAEVTAELCRFYRIPVSPQTVLGHGEVQATLGIRQRDKWDPMVLPWEPDMSLTQVGIAFRAIVQNHLDGRDETEEAPVRIAFRLGNGAPHEAIIANATVYAPVAAMLAAGIELPRSLIAESADGVTEGDTMWHLDGPYVALDDLARTLGRRATWSADFRTVELK